MNRQAMIVIGSLLGGLLLLGGLGWQFVLNPVSKDVAVKRAALAAKEEELVKVKGAQAQYDKFRREAEATRHDVQLLRERLDPELTAGELVRVINGQARSLNMRDMQWTFKPRSITKLAGQSGLDELPFSMTFKSDYETLGKLLNGLCSQLRLVSPERIVLSAYDDRAEGRLTVDAVVDFKIFLESPKGGG